MAIFIGTDGPDTIRGTSSLAETIFGNGGDDRLVAEGADSVVGGAGDDLLFAHNGATLVGGDGEDRYFVNFPVSGLLIVEDRPGEVDRLNALASHALSPGARIEIISIFNAGVSFVGNDFAQQIEGSLFDGLLDGGRNTSEPGRGDTLIGNGGNDIFVVRNPNDVLVDSDGGADIAFIDAASLQAAGQAVATFTLAAGVIIETLSAATHSGTEALVLTGNGSTQTIIGNFGNNTLNGGGDGDDTLIGLDGDDTYVIGGLGNITIIDSAGTDTISFALGVAPTFILNAGASIDVINLSANVNQVFGNEFAQRINGAAGDFDETLDGGGGADTLAGGGGEDDYFVDSADDVIIESGFAANGVTPTVDVVQFNGTTGGYALADGVNVDRLLAGAAGNVFLVGNSSSQQIVGNNGNNILNGAAGASGAGDTLYGGGGGDIYRVYSAADVVSEEIYDFATRSGVAGTDAGGVDTIFTSSSYSLATAFGVVETLSVADHSSTTTGIVLTGNVADNQIIGNMAANTLVGGGGADTLIGLGGDDFYILESIDDLLGQADIVLEAVGGGFDTITFAGAAGEPFVLGAGSELEVLRLGGGLALITGNEFGQTIYGTDRPLSETLIGGGGADTLVGGAGSDVYRVDSADDVIIETGLAPNGFTQTFDLVVFEGTIGGYALAEDVAIDDLRADAATGDVYLIGNSGAQLIIGNNGNNILDGGGGPAGLGDTLRGGVGDDIYRVYSADDRAEEFPNAGTDTVFTSSNFNLGLFGANIENLIAADARALNNLVLQGNAGNNSISGNFGRNVLAGGAGVDTLTGLGGADTFHFADVGAGNADVIADFSAAQGDRISLSAGAFTGFTGATITAAQFVLGVAATAADPQLLYDQATGRLFYDADGTSSGEAQIIATLIPGTALTNNDIVITPGSAVPTP